ncbi:hypothetical protein CCAX7_21160 [Capsulimonas corticalis]|uniref:Uncharacterized protein n=1 Tax=Capsulimonas corticalis TaxID=2219043 RepID=A0A402D1Z1_9BACT|nr:GGDEF domain-containing protein [Capsulimonas corticalis]BDI30065.1 hypothetical protein CCAX7_21160 [Capsulimonas corticalis]
MLEFAKINGRQDAPLEAIYSSITDSLLVLDRDLRVVEANDPLLRRLGRTRTEVVGFSWRSAFPELADIGREHDLTAVLETGRTHRGRIPLRDMSRGESLLFEIITYPICSADGNVTHLLEYAREVTEEVRLHLDILEQNHDLLDHRERLERAAREAEQTNQELAQKIAALEELNKRLERMAVIDIMTDLPNHRAFQERLEYEVKKGNRHQRDFTLLLIDVDDFKRYNDDFGHQEGDLVLAQVAALMRECVRAIDLPARYGGEEFAILLPETNEAGGAIVAERLVRLIGEHSFRRRPVTVSIGVAQHPVDAAEGSAIVECADRAMYAAKRGGKNNYRIWSEIAEG